jgi:hypothetical protein
LDAASAQAEAAKVVADGMAIEFTRQVAVEVLASIRWDLVRAKSKAGVLGLHDEGRICGGCYH